MLVLPEFFCALEIALAKLPKGSCNCGAVKFAVSVIPKDVYICHCSICRKATGGGGIAVTVVSNEKFEWLSGKELIKTWQKPNHDWETSFCSECGSSLPGKNDERAMYIPASLLDTGFEKLRIKQHLFVDSQAVWEEVSENGQA
jgi:hypothetical protein